MSTMVGRSNIESSNMNREDSTAESAAAMEMASTI